MSHRGFATAARIQRQREARKNRVSMSVCISRAVVAGTSLPACAAFLMAVGAAGCSSLDRELDTCETLNLTNCNPPTGNAGSGGSGAAGSDGTGGTEGNEPPPDMPEEWQCLTEDDVAPPPPTMPGTRVTYLAPVVDFDSPSPNVPLPVPGLQLTVCISTTCNPPAACFPTSADCDPDIAPPAAVVPPMTSTVVIQQPNPTQAPFLYAVNLPYGFDTVSIRARAPGYVPSEYFLGGPMTGTPEGGTTVIGLPFFLLTDGALNALYSQVGLDTPWDTSQGILAVRTIDCRRDMTVFSPDPNARQAARGIGVGIEIVGGTPAPPAEEWVLSFNKAAKGKQSDEEVLLTDNRGTAGFASLEPKNYTVRGIAPAPTGAEVGMRYGTTGAPIRRGVITIVEVREGVGLWGQ